MERRRKAIAEIEGLPEVYDDEPREMVSKKERRKPKKNQSPNEGSTGKKSKLEVIESESNIVNQNPKQISMSSEDDYET